MVRDLKANCICVRVLIERLPEQYSCSAGLYLWKLQALKMFCREQPTRCKITCCNCKLRCPTLCPPGQSGAKVHREKSKTFPVYQGLSHFANPLAIYKQQLSQGSSCWGRASCISLCPPQHGCISAMCLCLYKYVRRICVYLSSTICKLMATTNGSSSCAVSVLPPRKLLKKTGQICLINRVMQLIRKVGQADEFLTHNY